MVIQFPKVEREPGRKPRLPYGQQCRIMILPCIRIEREGDR